MSTLLGARVRFLIAIISSVSLLVPAFALAQEADVSANAQVEAQAQVPRPPKPTLFPSPNNIRKIASTTKQFLDERPKPGMMASTSGEVRLELKAKIEARRAEVAQHVQEVKARAAAKFGTAVQTSVGNIVDMLTRHTEQLVAMADKIDARVQELQAQGKDMSGSLTLLAQARTDITAAQGAVANVSATLTAALAAKTPKQELTKVREAVRTAEEAIRKAKDSLRQVLESVRAEGQISASAQTSTNTSVTP